MFYVYVLESETDGELYIGSTSDLKKRLKEHNHKQSPATKRYAPWHCIYCEMCLHEEDAQRREKFLKTSQGRRLLKRRLKSYFYNRR